MLSFDRRMSSNHGVRGSQCRHDQFYPHILTRLSTLAPQIIVWLPSLCKARGIPYCIVKSKARLGAVVSKKTATCLAITDVKPENKNDLENIITMATANFNDVYDDAMRKWGDAQPSGRQLAAESKRNKRD